MNRFAPLMTQLAAVALGAGRRPAGLEPAPGSVRAKDADDLTEATLEPPAFCSSVPKLTSTCPAMPLLVPNIERSARVV